MESGVVVFDGTDVVAHLYLCGQFFPDLPFKGILWGLSRLHFAPGELPEVLEITVPALGGKKLVVLDYDGCYYMDGLHRSEYSGKVMVWKGEAFAKVYIKILPKSILKIR